MEAHTIQLTLACIAIILCSICILIDLYLVVGMIFPDLNIRIERKLRKYLFKKPAIIILDSSYIGQRNIKLFRWIAIPLSVSILAIILIILKTN